MTPEEQMQRDYMDKCADAHEPNDAEPLTGICSWVATETLTGTGISVRGLPLVLISTNTTPHERHVAAKYIQRTLRGAREWLS